MKQTIYTGGTILTMAGMEKPEAVFVKDGHIAGVGTLEDLVCLAPQAEVADLQGCTLLPGFIDAHSHITSFAATLGLIDLTPCTDFNEIAKRIAAFCSATPPQDDNWITAFGYDHNALTEHRHPDKAFLDALCPHTPLLIVHASGHMGVCNSAALRALGITAQTPDPAGGRIGREPDSREPNGYLEEAAFTGIGAQIPPPDTAQLAQALDRAQDIYLSYGITTAQDGLTRSSEWSQLSAAASSGRLKLDIVCYPDFAENPDLVQNDLYRGRYCNRLKVGGYKLFLDGSPQGRTAWMSSPYLGTDPNYCGYAIHTDAQVLAWMARALQEQVQVLVHCNGDAAAQQMIDSYAAACAKTGATGIRPVMIHAQLVRHDQLAQMAKLGMLASFFVAHTYYWGDVHLQNLGAARADFISPAASAQKAGVLYTFHQDTPVLPPDMLDTIQCAVRRVTKAGVALASSECVSVYDALKAVTINAAFQYFEEGDKGSIEVGKRADFVVLDQDPLTCPHEKLNDIRVLATIKDGECVYTANT